MYAVIIFTILISFGLQASNRDKWEIYPFVQEKIDEILEKTGRKDHGENKLFVEFKYVCKDKFALRSNYGPAYNKPFIDIVEEGGYEVIEQDRIKPLLYEITSHVKTHLSDFEKDKINKVTEIEKYTEELEGKEKEAVVKVRINQDKFREKLINKYKKCRLCNVNMNDLLVASHIKPWSISDANEKLDIHNGLLMCPNHDKLFDRGYISFDDTGRILISERLDDNNRMYMNITAKMKIDIAEENIKYIKYHRKNVFIEK